MLGSKSKLSQVLKHRGICLTTGKEHGKALPRVLMNNKKLMIKKERAKSYEFVKYCLVTVYGASYD